MKPDTPKCANCEKDIVRGRWCSDKCRKVFTRKSDNPDKVGQINPDTDKKSDKTQPGQPKSDKVGQIDEFRTKLTKTDKTFYDRAMKDFKKPYYNFELETIRSATCILQSCGRPFTTSLSMLNYCSYEHYTRAISGRK